MDKNRLYNLVLYHFNSTKVIVGILLLIMLVNLILGFIFKGNEDAIGSIDIASYVFAVFVGAGIFNEAFSFSIINGISRKTYYVSNILSILFISLMLALATSLATVTSIAIAKNNILFTALFELEPLSLFVWCFSAIYAIITLFHFIALVSYRLSDSSCIHLAFLAVFKKNRGEIIALCKTAA